MIIIDRTNNTVNVNGTERTVDLSSIAVDIDVIQFDPLTRAGSITRLDGSIASMGASNFAVYERYVRQFKGLAAPAITLADAKINRRQQINSHRDNLEQSGFPYLTKTVDSDPVSVQRITVAAQAAQAAYAASADFEISWTCQDNSVLTLDAMGMMGMPVALAMFAKNLHETAWAKKDLIDEATTIEEVEAVTWE